MKNSVLASVRKDNKGFTLLEVVVTLAILGLVALTVAGFVGISSTSYVSINNDLALQYESQLVVAQVRERLVDVNGGVSFDTNNSTLYIVNKNTAENTYTAHRIRRNSSDNMLYYSTSEIVYDETIPGYVCDLSEEHLIGENVSVFSVAFVKTGEKNVAKVGISLTIKGKTYENIQNIGIRNDIDVCESFDELIKKICPQD